METWRRGDRIEVFFSLRYTPETVGHRASDAGLEVVESRVSQCGREGLFSLRQTGTGTGAAEGAAVDHFGSGN
jgi:hypothetical protein